ncbi:MAG: NADH-quinone oxidoreductase subunit NuoN [Alphaproteobacteria bacterium]|nr:NADH-quinone oxidoreductase subunit NuoN [Alphaproteobacteria bacterium]
MLISDIQTVLPEIFLAVVGMGLLIYGVFIGDKSMRQVSWLTVFALITAAAMLYVFGSTGEPEIAMNGLFISDAFAHYAKLFILLGAALAVVMSVDFMEREQIIRFEFPILILYASLGMMMMVSANDLMSLYIALELQSLPLYVVASIRRDSLRSTEAGLKYFVLGALSSGMLLYGCSMIYGFTGSTNFDAIAAAVAAGGVSTGLVIGIVFLMAGLAFKVSAAPFHMWTPDVYEGAPTPVTALFAVAPKIAAIALFSRVMISPFGEAIEAWQQVVILISILSMALGSIAAIAQTNIKRLMAYSSIGHMGFALVGLAAGTETGIRGVMIYMAIYLFMNVGTFAIILSMRQQGRMVEGINDLAGLSKTSPGMALALTIFMFSMAGIPPLAGFFSKLYVFSAAIEAGLVTLAILGVIASVIGAFYYLRIIKVMYFDAPVEPIDDDMPRETKAIMAVTAFVTLFFFIWPSPIVDGAAQAASVLFGG